MSAMSDYLENSLADYLFRGQAMTLPSALHVALFTTAVAEDGTGTEVSGNGYARVSINRDLNAWSGTQAAGSTSVSSGTGGAISNNAPITFPAATANWPDPVTHWALFDAASGGNLICSAPLTTPKTVLAGDAPNFAAATLSLILQ